MQATDYYPFGKSFENNDVPKNRYLYNGKELQDQVIGGTPFGWYDYGARFYDPEIGRWHSVDPLAEKYRRWSTYNYCEDNPLIFTDPDGMGPKEFLKALAKSFTAAVTVGLQAGFEAKAGTKPAIALYANGGSKDVVGVRDGAVSHIAQQNTPTRYETSVGIGSVGSSTTAETQKEAKTVQIKMPYTNQTLSRVIEVEKGTKTTSVSIGPFSVGAQKTAEIQTDTATGQQKSKVSENRIQSDVDLASKLNVKVSAIIGFDFSIDINKIVKAFDELKK